MILDPSDAPGFDFEHLRDHLDRRLPYLPSFRRRIQEVPLGLDRPVWVDDPVFKLDYHIHRAALPAPGGEKELADVVGEILARQLNRNQPLWESWFVEGLEGGRVAFIAKTHPWEILEGAKAELDRLLAASGGVEPAPKKYAPAAKEKADAAVPPGGSSAGSAE